MHDKIKQNMVEEIMEKRRNIKMITEKFQEGEEYNIKIISYILLKLTFIFN